MSVNGRAPSLEAAPKKRLAVVRRPGKERVREIQRARILTAMIDVAVERGAGSATVAHIVERAGVSRRTFYEIFEDREDCFLAALEGAIRELGARIVPAYELGTLWQDRIRAALVALMDWFEEDPRMGRLVIVEAPGAGHKALERRALVLSQAIAALEDGRKASRRAADPPPLTAEGLVGGVLALIHTRLLSAEPEALTELLNPLMSMIVLPYLGTAAARKELAKPIPGKRLGARRSGFDPLRDLDMRLTYRTVRVLMAIGSQPGASNRKVADVSGIRDQGQVSKLLARLEKLGLVCKVDETHTKGEPNAWLLTEQGVRVHEAVRLQTEPA